MNIPQRHVHFSLAIVIILTMLLAACGGGEPVAETTPEPTEPRDEGLSSNQPGETKPAGRPTPTDEAAQEPNQTPVQGTTERSRTVIFDVDGGRVDSPDLWNPYVPGSRTDQGFHQAMIEPLFILNYNTGEVDPWLGESFTPNKNLDVWTLKLRDGIKWSDGEDFNADDVVFTISMLKNGPIELNWAASIQEWVESVEKVDDLTVRFQLTKPNPRFQLDYFSVKLYNSIYILPEHIWKGKDPLTFKNYDPERGWPVFTGPYTLASVRTTEFVYERDPDWWGAEAGFRPLPKPERLVWTVNDTEEVKIARAAEGDLDAVMDITLGAWEALQARNPNFIAWRDQLPYSFVDPCARQLSLNNAKEPWDDKEMRWALNYAIDRDQIVEIAYEGTTEASTFMFPAYPPLVRYMDLLEEEGVYDKYPVGTHDPAKAKEIIESKGYTMGDDGYYEKDDQQLALQIIAHESFIELRRVAQVVVEQLQDIGINATMRILAGDVWGENQAFGRYEAATAWNSCGSVNEPWSSMNHYTDQWLVPIGQRATDNPFRWKNERYSKLVDQMDTLPLDDPRIDPLFVEASEIWLSELPAIPLTQAKKLIPFDTTYWTGWPTADNFYSQPETWWNSTHMVIHNLEPTGEE